MTSPIEQYLLALRRELRHDPLLARRLCEEVADHLAEIAAHERSRGMSTHDAESEAVRRFGAPGPLARQFERFLFPLKTLLTCAAISTTVTALWIGRAVAVIMPLRDPAHVPVWTAIGILFLLYAGLTLVFVVRGPRPVLLRPSVVLLSLGAVAFGVRAISGMLAAASRGGHFEGYLLLMGAAVAGHGVVALLYAALTAAIGRRVRASS